MKKSTHIKIAVTLGIIIVLIIAAHLFGSNVLPMIKNHLGM